MTAAATTRSILPLSFLLLLLVLAEGGARPNPRPNGRAAAAESPSVGERGASSSATITTTTTTTTTSIRRHRVRSRALSFAHRPPPPRRFRSPGGAPVEHLAAAAASSSIECSAEEEASSESADREAVIQELGYLPPNFLRISGRTTTAGDGDGGGGGGRGGRPVAIQTYPLNGGARRRRAKARGKLTPFPTLYWLCNSDISRAVADMERRGYVKILEERIRSSSSSSSSVSSSGDDADCAAAQFRRCHVEYAEDRWGTLTEEDRIMLESGVVVAAGGDGGGDKDDDDDGEERGNEGRWGGEKRINERMVDMIRRSGVAGTDYLSGSSAEGGDAGAAEPSFVPSVKCLHAHYAHYRSGGETNIVGKWTDDILREEYPDVDL